MVQWLKDLNTRHGAVWKEVCENLDYFSSLLPAIAIGVTHTVSSLNVMIAEFIKFLQNVGQV